MLVLVLVLMMVLLAQAPVLVLLLVLVLVLVLVLLPPLPPPRRPPLFAATKTVAGWCQRLAPVLPVDSRPQAAAVVGARGVQVPLGRRLEQGATGLRVASRPSHTQTLWTGCG